MLARVLGATLLGVDARIVEVQVDLSKTGLPGTQTVGLPGTAVRESQDRVRIAIRNSGLGGPPSRVTINLAPADLPKHGSALDLAVAAAILLAEQGLPHRPGWLLAGEVALDGTLRPIAGALPITIAARQAGLAKILLPEGNAAEAAAIGGIETHGFRDLKRVLSYLSGEGEGGRVEALPYRAEDPESAGEDLADVRGQTAARRALEVAAAGAHNLLLIGSPGAGKTMLARRLRTILPPLSSEEAIEVTRIASAAGLVPPGGGLCRVRPFRAPHHSITSAGLIGGGHDLRPGEVSLASEGVLFLDELPEFARGLLDQLRQPIEDGELWLVRHRYRCRLPCRFLLVAGMNPCPCGWLGHPKRACRCTPVQVVKYKSRISGPLWDRFDMVVEVPPVPVCDLEAPPTGESSRPVRERVRAAREFGRRIPELAASTAAPAERRGLPDFSWLEQAAADLLRTAASRLSLSARAVHRVLRVSRTIANLDESERIAPRHLAEALRYRPRIETV